MQIRGESSGGGSFRLDVINPWHWQQRRPKLKAELKRITEVV